MTDAVDPNAARNQAIGKWLADKALANAAVEAERQAREAVIAMLFPSPIEGTNNYELGQGYKLSLQHSFRRDLGDKELVVDGQKVPTEDQVNGALEAIEELGNDGALLAKRLVRWKPELSVSEYKKLDPNSIVEMQAKAIIDGILITKPASPQLSYKEPK